MRDIGLLIEMEDREHEAPERRFLAGCEGFEGEGRSQAEALGRLLHGMFAAKYYIDDFAVRLVLAYAIEPEPEFTSQPEPSGRLVLPRKAEESS